MLLNANNLALAALASKDAGRGTLAGVYVSPWVTVATDGHCLGMVSTPTRETADPADFPNCAGLYNGQDALPPPAIIPAAVCEKAKKSIPKKAAAKFPILAHVAVVGENGSRRLVTTDLETTTPLETAVQPADTFPDFNAVMPTAAPTFSIAMNPALLAKVLTVAASMGLGTVRIDATGRNEPLKITGENLETGQTAVFLVMPMTMPAHLAQHAPLPADPSDA